MAVVTIVFVFIVKAMAVVLERPKAGILAAAPLAIMTAVAELASAAGAAWTEWPESVPAMFAALKTTPRFAKNVRSFSKARLTRFRAVTSFSFNAAATSCGVRFSKASIPRGLLIDCSVCFVHYRCRRSE